MNNPQPETEATSPPATGSAVVVAHCVLCKEPLTRPGGKKWWIGGSRYDEGLCYDCILAGMRVIMAGVSYAQEHGEGTNANPPND